MVSSDLWDLIKGKDQSKDEKEDDGTESTILVLGPGQSGKSVILNTFFDKDDPLNSTIGLEYSFARKTKGQGLNTKDICHVWELGGDGIEMKELMLVPVNENNLHTSTVVIVFDLSKPKTSAEFIETFEVVFNPHIENILQSLESRGSKRPKALRSHAEKRYGTGHPDLVRVQPFAVPVVVVATKYDHLKSLHPEKQLLISKALRWFAHMRGASLVYLSDKDAVARNKLKSVLNNYSFRTPLDTSMAQNNTDYTKPIFIAAGKDSFSHIFAASDKALGFKSWTNWKEEIFKVFSGDEEPVSANLIPLNEDKHPDIFLDNLKSQKENEIELLKEEFNQSVRNAKLAAK